MKNTFYILITILGCFNLKSQNLSPVEELLVRTNIAMERDTSSQVGDQFMGSKFTSYQLLVSFNVDAVNDSADVVIEIGSSQNSGDVLSKPHKFMYHSNQPTQRCFHTDENPDIEIGPINFGYATVKISLTSQQYANANWTNVYVSKGQQQSRKKHFQIK
jgi:hypothetical protein